MSYDMIDRFLRNNLGDDDYAEYSAALDSLVQPAQPQPTDPRIATLKAKCRTYEAALEAALQQFGNTSRVLALEKEITALEAKCKDYEAALDSVISAMTLGVREAEEQQHFCEILKSMLKSLLKTVQKVLAKHGIKEKS